MYLAVLGLSGGTQASLVVSHGLQKARSYLLHSMWDLSSPTRN